MKNTKYHNALAYRSLGSKLLTAGILFKFTRIFIVNTSGNFSIQSLREIFYEVMYFHKEKPALRGIRLAKSQYVVEKATFIDIYMEMQLFSLVI